MELWASYLYGKGDITRILVEQVYALECNMVFMTSLDRVVQFVHIAKDTGCSYMGPID